MYADVDVRYMDASSDEITDISRTLKQLEEEIESVNRVLAEQSEFTGHITRLREINSALGDKRYRLASLSQALRNIANLYRRTETSIDENFETSKPRYTDVNVGNYDYSDVNERTEQVLYGGDR